MFLKSQKLRRFKSILINVFKENCDYFAHYFCDNIPAGIYLFKVNNRNTRTRCEICSKLTINYCIESSKFPSNLKSSVLFPIYKKNPKVLKMISDQSPYYQISPKYKKWVYDQIQVYFETMLSKYQLGCRKSV